MGQLVMLFILVFCVAALYFFIDYSKYEKSSYKSTTDYNYSKVRFNAGFYGEYLSFNILDEIEGKKFILTNVYLPKEKGGTTEIDVVMIHEKGIFVIESKNYSGWIYGSEKNKTWTQTFKSGRKEKFYNPIWQNQTHIKTLMRVLSLEDSTCVKSIIAFSERCTLKKVEVNSTDVKVINRNDLRRTVKNIIKDKDVIFTIDELIDFYCILKSYTNVSEEVKEEHIKSVSAYKA